MSVDRITERGHVAREGHAGSDVAPQGARVVHSHLGLRDVCRDAEIRDPQVLAPGCGEERHRKVLRQKNSMNCQLATSYENAVL